MAARRFAVVLTERGSRRRDRLLVEAASPLAAAVDAFLRCTGGLPEIVEVDPVTVLDEQARLAVSVVSSEGTRFRLHVTPEDPA